MTFAEQVKQTLLNDISDMAKNPGTFSKHPEKDFSRNRKISFQTLLHFYLSMEGRSIRGYNQIHVVALFDLFSHCPAFPLLSPHRTSQGRLQRELSTCNQP